MHLAASKNQITIMECLLLQGGSTSTEDGEGNTPLHIASEKGLYVMVHLILVHMNRNGLLKDLEKHNDQGMTALMLAAKSGVPEPFELLLMNGADLLAKDKD